MKIGFFGTPLLASRCLQTLREHYNVSFVVTAEDKPQGRNRKLKPCPVKELALELGIDIFQPANLGDARFIDSLKENLADIFVVVAYGKILPRKVFDLPPLKTINLHPSLLPRYRGAAPIEWAIINGDSETGITVQVMDEELDAGDIVIQESFPVHLEMTSADVYDIVLDRGPLLLRKAIEKLSSDEADRIPQDESLVTYCSKIDSETARIRWTKSSLDIHNIVRGLNPKPVAYTTFRGDIVKIWKTALVQDIDFPEENPGSLKIINKKRLMVYTGDGLLEILQLQPASKKKMDGLSFINGYRISKDDSFQ